MLGTRRLVHGEIIALAIFETSFADFCSRYTNMNLLGRLSLE